MQSKGTGMECPIDPIAVNLRSFVKGAIGGLEEVVAHLIPALDRHESGQGRKLTVFCQPNQEDNVRQIASSAEIVSIQSSPEGIRSHLMETPHRLLFCPLMVLEPIDSSIPGAVLIPDLQHEYFPQYFAPGVLRWRRANFWPSVVRARVVLTISEFTKKTILEKYGISPDKIVVLDLDAARTFKLPCTPRAEAAFHEFRLPAAYFFYPANFWPHKNHANLLRALQILRKTNPDVALVFTGEEVPDPAPVLRMAAELGLSDAVRYLGHVDREILVPLYQHALGLSFVSQFEGCGLPILEAFNCGTPVIASHAASCPEIAGDAGLFVDSGQPGEIAAAMFQFVRDDALREELKRRGKLRAADRSWERTIAVALQALEAAAKPPRFAAVTPQRARPAGCWCGATDSEPFSPEYVRCKSCLTLYLSVPPADDFTCVDEYDQGFYGVDYWLGHQEKVHAPSREERARMDLPERNVYWLSHLLRRVPLGKRVLEIGCAHGSFVALMRQAGYDAVGLEMSTTIAAFAQATFDVPVLVAPIDRYPELRGSFDAIVAMDVIEHFLDPIAELSRYVEFLSPEGALIIQTPCFWNPARSWEELKGVGDSFLAQSKPEHIFLLNEDSLRRLLQQIGFTEVAVLPALYSYDQFVVASRQKLMAIEPEEYEPKLMETPKGRMALALLDGSTVCNMYRKAAEERLIALNAATAECTVLRKAAYERLTALNAVTAAYHLVRKSLEERRARRRQGRRENEEKPARPNADTVK
jgi:glycosyltransferase involved in cell wall biosynthesis/cyclopropane fatty-acyl-phospholipid synthase-like methyltransferase